MRPDVERLTRVLGVPEFPSAQVPWDLAPRDVGFQFPQDYRELIDVYGSIRINGMLSVWRPKLRAAAPDIPGGFAGFIWHTTREGGVGDYLAGAYEAGDLRECPYPVFSARHSARGGLLAWGSTPNGDHCFWLTEGDDSDGWPIVVRYRQLAVWSRFDGGIADFLTAVVTRDYPLADEIAPADPDSPLWRRQSDWAS
jgi:hypothetical protein